MKILSEKHDIRASRFAWAYSLRFRLTVGYTGVLAVILIGVASLVLLGMRQALREQADEFLTTEASRIVAVARGEPGDRPDLGDLADAVGGSIQGLTALPAPDHRPQIEGLRSGVTYVRLVTWPERKPLAVSPGLAVQPALLASLDLLLGRTHGGRLYAFAGPDEERMMRVLTMPLHLPSGNVTIQVAAPWDHDADLLERLAALLLLGAGAVLLLAAAGGWALVGRTLRPIGRIVAEVECLDAAALPAALLPAAGETDSEIGRLVGTLNRMMTRLRHAFQVQGRFAEAQQRFAADASHELRTPLTILRGELELALSRSRTAESYQATLSSAVEEVARMSRIVAGLAFLARRDAGQIEEAGQEKEDVDLSALCRATAGEFQPMAVSKKIALSLHPWGGTEELRVQGNAAQLRQLLSNLLDNALKYTPHGGRVKIVTDLLEETAEATLTVQDTGIGIAPEDLPQVFDRFWRADRSRAGEGTGLGLAISADIARAHEGCLNVRSTAGMGSEFQLRLPLAAHSAEAD